MGFLAVLARVGGALAFVPLPGFRNTPETARVVLAIALAGALVPFWPALEWPDPLLGGLLLLVASECALGMVAGLAVAFLIESLLVAAQVFGLQAGYSYASTIDPSTEADSNVLLVLAQLMAGMMFFSLGLDREVLRAFAASLTTHPAGSFIPSARHAEALVRLGTDMLATGVRLALPVVALLAMVDLTLALLGRLHQQLQLITIAFPAKMLATLAFLASISVLYFSVFRGASARTVRFLFGL